MREIVSFQMFDNAMKNRIPGQYALMFQHVVDSLTKTFLEP